MTLDEIATRIISALNPVARNSWFYEVSETKEIIVAIFRPKSLAMILDIKAVQRFFDPDKLLVSWQGGQGDEPDLPRIVFQGGLIGHTGKVVQATFVLKDAS